MQAVEPAGCEMPGVARVTEHRVDDALRVRHGDAELGEGSPRRTVVAVHHEEQIAGLVRRAPHAGVGRSPGEEPAEQALRQARGHGIAALATPPDRRSVGVHPVPGVPRIGRPRQRGHGVSQSPGRGRRHHADRVLEAGAEEIESVSDAQDVVRGIRIGRVCGAGDAVVAEGRHQAGHGILPPLQPCHLLGRGKLRGWRAAKQIGDLDGVALRADGGQGARAIAEEAALRHP